jgi:uncharacterized protein (DUF305 family)
MKTAAFFSLILFIQAARPQFSQDAPTAWAGLQTSMKTMHAAMAAVTPSGDPDLDFVKLMLPHHQAAIDMAKVQLIHGKDPQMKRLAQEIITDQQSEIELMQLWLRQHDSSTAHSSH